MALFGKKPDDAAPKPAKTPKPPKAPKAPGAKKGIGFGKKKGVEAAPPPLLPGDAPDMSEFADAEAPKAPDNGYQASAARPAKTKTIKNGSIVGLNIGQFAIKAVEVTVKGGELAITAAGEIPTPPESITNGVVINTTALANAIRELMKSAGIKSKQIVTSVSGTGSLVVRVIEVPRMGDKELEENMRQDAERYIPFPPSEVIMDFKALRELPSDPDAPNMEVLLAAAQREIVDAHIAVVDRAKLDPRAIDVEPLAAARAVAELGLTDEVTDYFDVTALINLGATSSEISVLRGDLLVFTRIVPKGGNDFTQALVDHLALPWHDAERLKVGMGDALMPQEGVSEASSEDWGDFGVLDNTAQTANPFDDQQYNADDQQYNAEDFQDFAEPAPAAPQLSSDPFAPEFFDQGPVNREPGEQHGQKQDEPFNFDFSFDQSAEPAKEDAPPAPAPAPAQPAAAGDSALNFSFPEETAPLAADAAPAVPNPLDISFSSDAESAQWQMPPETLAPATPVASSGFSMEAAEAPPVIAPALAMEPDELSQPAPAPSLDLPDFDTLVAESGDIEENTASATIDSAYDLSDFTSAGASGAAAPVAVEIPATGDDDFDLDALFGDQEPVAEQDFAAFNTPAPVAAPMAALDDFGFGDFENFGAGLSDSSDAPMEGIDAATVHSILLPQLEELVNEVRRSLEYHASRYPDAAVRRVVLIGGGAALKNIDAYFTQQLGIPTAIGNPLARLPLRASQLAPDYIDRNGPALAVALGLAVRDMV